jgi:hypothetical protein
MHAAAAAVGRSERVDQVRRRDPTVRAFDSYVPTPGTVQKLVAWSERGAALFYLSARRRRRELDDDEMVVRRSGFPPGPVCGRRGEETYGELVERLELEVVVEDDCESIGGAAQTIAAQLTPSQRVSIRCIVVPEFIGLGMLPDDPHELLPMRL